MSKDEALKLALEALEWCHGGEPCGTAEAITALRKALADQSNLKQVIELYDSPDQPAQQEPVAKPYAYEYGRDNGDGTYSVVIEKGDLMQTAPAVYNYVRPRNAHKDWPIKELFDHPPAQQWQSTADKCELEKVPANGSLLPAQQEPVAWNVIDPTGKIVATEANAIRGWARIQGYKPTVEVLLAFHEQGWRVVPTIPPAQRTWVGLTDGEVTDCIKFPGRNLFARDGTTSQQIARAIEAKLKEKNNA